MKGTTITIIFEKFAQPISRQPPFGYENENNPDIQKKILKGIDKQHFEHFDDKDLVDLISKLLEVNTFSSGIMTIRLSPSLTENAD